MKLEKAEEERANFLKKVNKNVIVWGGSRVPVEQWKKSKKLEDIQELRLGN